MVICLTSLSPVVIATTDSSSIISNDVQVIDDPVVRKHTTVIRRRINTATTQTRGNTHHPSVASMSVRYLQATPKWFIRYSRPPIEDMLSKAPVLVSFIFSGRSARRQQIAARSVNGPLHGWTTLGVAPLPPGHGSTQASHWLAPYGLSREGGPQTGLSHWSFTGLSLHWSLSLSPAFHSIISRLSRTGKLDAHVLTKALARDSLTRLLDTSLGVTPFLITVPWIKPTSTIVDE